MTGRAALFVVVCESRCVNAPGLREQSLPVTPRSQQRIRQISMLGNNIGVIVTESGGGAGRRLQAHVQPILNELDVAEDPDSRSYIG